MKQVEDIGAANGITGIKEINAQMAPKLEAQKILQAMNNKRVKVSGGSTGREVVADIAGAAGEVGGSALGLPFAGTLGARGLSRSILKASPKTALTKLSRPTRTTGGTVKGLLQLPLGVAGSTATLPRK